LQFLCNIHIFYESLGHYYTYAQKKWQRYRTKTKKKLKLMKNPKRSYQYAAQSSAALVKGANCITPVSLANCIPMQSQGATTLTALLHLIEIDSAIESAAGVYLLFPS